MQARLLFVFALIFVVLTACQTTVSTTPVPTPLPVVMPATTQMPSFKGWELYSWPQAEHWRFVLLNGTNRLKTAGEILSSEAVVIDTVGIKNELARLPRGEEVFWNLDRMPEFSFPPAAVIQELEQFCTDRGIKLTVVR